MQQLDLVTSPFAGRTLIEASAGTGKTWTLTALYARQLLAQRLSVGRMLVVTFTKAATGELRERLRTRLAELLAVYEQGPGPDALLNRLQAEYPDADSHRRVLLAVHGFDEAPVFTIHGFCQRALQDSAFEAGVDFDSALTHNDEALMLTLLNDLWRQELAAAEPLWAGYLLSHKIQPQTLIGLLRRYVNKPYLHIEPPAQARQPLPALQERWSQAAALWQTDSSHWLTELEAHGGLSKTTHSSARFAGWQAQLDGYFAEAGGLWSPPEALTKLGAEALRKGTKVGQRVPVSQLADSLDALSSALAETQAACDRRLIQLKVRLLQSLNSLLPKHKAAQRQLTFDDLSNQLYGALLGAAGERLAASLRERYPVALVDEFQDTDPTQYAIFNRIYPDSEPADLCLVGDPKQAIYAFRGADLATYLHARSQATRQYGLTTNQRSTPELIGALNHLFQRPQAFAEPGLDYVPVSASQRSRPRLRLAETSAPLTLVWLGDEPLGKLAAGQLAAQDSARRIAALLDSGQTEPAAFQGEGMPAKPLRGADIAVLVYKHQQADQIAAELAARGVASVRRGQDNIWHCAEAAELAAVLAAYAEPGREGLLRYALASRLLGRNPTQLSSLTADSSSWDDERAQADRYHQLWQQRGFLRLFRTWLEEQAVPQRLLRQPDGERSLTNLLHLGELLQEASLQRTGVEPLLSWFAEQRRSQTKTDDALLRLESDAERVQIVTIHAAKGLEYPVVFCPYLWDGQLTDKDNVANCHDEAGQPLADFGGDQFAMHQQRSREERFAERLRLSYVALTRARDYLWLYSGPIDASVKTKKDGTIRKEGLHTSPLAWLLHGRQMADAGNNALAMLAEHLEAKTPLELHQEVAALAQTSHGGIALSPPLAQEQHLGEGLHNPQPSQLATLERPLQSAWRVSSFSGLAANQHSESADRDPLSSADTSEPGNGFFAFPRGARAGTCLHAIFEDWAKGKGPIDALVAPALTAHGIDADTWQEPTRRLLQQVLACDLDGQGLTLAGLAPARRLAEVSFTFPVKQLDMAALRQLLSDPAMGLEAAAREAAQRLTFDSLKGYLKGFIDLVFEQGGRWYIADYKSNWLGPTTDHYHTEPLRQAIADAHYYLQYLIYLLALRRFLHQRLSGFQDSQLGGAWYLFLRGMPRAGVYFFRPPDHLLDALDRLFQEGS